MQLQTGTLLHQGEYRILSVLGQGGFGITYLGLQQGLERRVAIKEFFMKDLCNRNEGDSQVSVLSEGARQQVDRFRQKFLKEAKTLAALDNPHIIRIYNVFEENGTAYYVMEYIEDGSLKDLVTARGPLPEAEALGYIRQLADALGYLHRQKILHLDLKPANVLLKGGQTAVLIDFGISKHYGEDGGQTSSTPIGISQGYAPLEQYNAGGVSRFQPCTDIYSLGATLYTLVTGQVPPAATDVNNDGLPALPTFVSIPTAHAIEKSMIPQIKNRPQGIEEFIRLLQSLDEETTESGEDKVLPKERLEKTKLGKLSKIIEDVVIVIVDLITLLKKMLLTKSTPKKAIELDYTPLFTPYRNAKRKYGFIGITTKEDSLKIVVIPPKYDYVYNFNEGFARIKLNGKYGYINKLGIEIISLKYDDAWDYEKGMAKVFSNGKYGYINKLGEEVIPLKYDDIYSFYEGFAKIKLNKKCGYVNVMGKEIVPSKYDNAWNYKEGMAKVFSNGKFGYINKLGEEIIPLKYDYADSFNEGIAVVELNNKKLYINKLGEEVIPLKNEKIKEKSTETILEKKCKYINNNKKKEIILCQYDRATDFCNGLALVQTGNICYFITPKGERLLETTIDGELQISSGQG